jgi:nuclear migration protein JNM1
MQSSVAATHITSAPSHMLPLHNHFHVHPSAWSQHSIPALRRREGSMHQEEGSLCGDHTGAPYSAASEQVERNSTPELVNLSEWCGEFVRRSLSLLLPMLTKLDTQLTTLTQPRTTDSISRRLKLLLTDLDWIAAANPAR